MQEAAYLVAQLNIVVVDPTTGNLGSVKTSDRSLSEQASQDTTPDSAYTVGSEDIQSFIDPQDEL